MQFKKYLSQQTSQSSLSCTTKLSRRQEKNKDFIYKSRSKSKESTDDLRKFFVKHIPQEMVKSNISAVENGFRNNHILNNLQSDRNKKRTPTPFCSQKNQNIEKKKKQFNNEINVEKQLILNRLQKQFKAQQKLRQVFEQKAKKFELDLIQKIKKIKVIQQAYRQINQKNIQNEEKIKFFQIGILQKENNLMQVQNKFDHYQNVIVENRLQLLETTNKKLIDKNLEEKSLKLEIQTQNHILKQQMNKLGRQLQKIRQKIDLQTICKIESMRELYLSKQVENLRKQLTRNKTMQQNFLQFQLHKKDEYIYKLKQKIRFLEVKVDYFNRKKAEECEQLRERKNYEIQVLREKFVNTVGQMRKMSRKLTLNQQINQKNKSHSNDYSLFKLDLSP